MQRHLRGLGRMVHLRYLRCIQVLEVQRVTIYLKIAEFDTLGSDTLGLYPYTIHLDSLESTISGQHHPDLNDFAPPCKFHYLL